MSTVSCQPTPLHPNVSLLLGSERWVLDYVLEGLLREASPPLSCMFVSVILKFKTAIGLSAWLLRSQVRGAGYALWVLLASGS